MGTGVATGSAYPTKDADGNLLWERARLDLRLEGGPEEPTTYGDVVVSHPESAAWVGAAANTDGATAESAARGKHSRYPAWALPGGRLVPFSVETFGRWGAEALDWLRDAAHAAGHDRSWHHRQQTGTRRSAYIA